MSGSLTRRVLFAVVVFIFTCAGNLSAQRVTIQGDDITLLRALEELEIQSDYTVAYDRTKIDIYERVSLRMSNVSLTNALDAILKDRASYKMVGSHIFLTPHTPKIEPEVTVDISRHTYTARLVAPEAIRVSSALAQFEEIAIAAPVVIPQELEECIPHFLTVKTNVLYDLTGTINVGAELRLGRKFTVDVPVNYNGWDFGNGKKWKHVMVQPELRYWDCTPFLCQFVGVYAVFAGYDMGNIDVFGIGADRYNGYMYGAGLSYGLRWPIGGRWSMEGTLGLGYVRLEYDKYSPEGRFSGQGGTNYFGPTKLGLSFIFHIK